MALLDEINADIASALTTPWNHRTATALPTSQNVLLGGGAAEIEAVFLYADLANSSKIAKELDRRIAARILKAFLSTSSRLIRARSGHVVSFDGDRVLGVFIDGPKNTNAARCALNIAWSVQQIRNRFSNTYSSVRDASFQITHGVGIDRGTVLAVRAGIRNANDLIWIGRAPNLAAKLSDIRDFPNTTHVTATVYNTLLDSSKLAHDGTNMWSAATWTFLGENIRVYRSRYYAQP